MRGMQYRVGAVLLVLAIGILLAACFLLGAAHLTSSLTGEQQTPIVSAVLVAFTAVYTVVVTQWIKESVFGPFIILGFGAVCAMVRHVTIEFRKRRSAGTRRPVSLAGRPARILFPS